MQDGERSEKLQIELKQAWLNCIGHDSYKSYKAAKSNEDLSYLFLLTAGTVARMLVKNIALPCCDKRIVRKHVSDVPVHRLVSIRIQLNLLAMPFGDLSGFKCLALSV